MKLKEADGYTKPKKKDTISYSIKRTKSSGSMPEWLMGADCKSAGLPTLVQIQFGPIDKRGCGGMVDTGDLKSPAAYTAWGFKSPQPQNII